MLLFHIIIACLSLVYTGYVYFSPSQSKLNLAYGLVALTIGSGTYLVFVMPAHLSQTCFTGLGYLAVASVGIFFARQKLVAKI